MSNSNKIRVLQGFDIVGAAFKNPEKKDELEKLKHDVLWFGGEFTKEISMDFVKGMLDIGYFEIEKRETK